MPPRSAAWLDFEQHKHKGMPEPFGVGRARFPTDGHHSTHTHCPPYSHVHHIIRVWRAGLSAATPDRAKAVKLTPMMASTSGHTHDKHRERKSCLCAPHSGVLKRQRIIIGNVVCQHYNPDFPPSACGKTAV